MKEFPKLSIENSVVRVIFHTGINILVKNVPVLCGHSICTIEIAGALILFQQILIANRPRMILSPMFIANDGSILIVWFKFILKYIFFILSQPFGANEIAHIPCFITKRHSILSLQRFVFLVFIMGLFHTFWVCRTKRRWEFDVRVFGTIVWFVQWWFGVAFGSLLGWRDWFLCIGVISICIGRGLYWNLCSFFSNCIIFNLSFFLWSWRTLHSHDRSTVSVCATSLSKTGHICNYRI